MRPTSRHGGLEPLRSEEALVLDLQGIAGVRNGPHSPGHQYQFRVQQN